MQVEAGAEAESVDRRGGDEGGCESRASLRVAYLDDNATWRRALVRAGPMIGANVVAVATVTELHELEAGAAFDAVVCDFSLGGGKTSAAVVARLRSWKCPVVVFTGEPRVAREAVGPDVAVVAKADGVSGLRVALPKV